MTVLSICTGAGLLDRAFMDAGFNVVPGCEIDPDQRQLYAALCGGAPVTNDLKDLPDWVRGAHFRGIIGGPSCQAHTKLRAIRAPKFPDLTPLVLKLLDAVTYDWFLFENVVPIAIPGAEHILLDAMHFGAPHQSRPRWFTFKGLTPPRSEVQRRCKQPHGLPGSVREALRPETRRHPPGVPGVLVHAVSLRPTPKGAGKCRTVSARVRVGGPGQGG